MAQDVDNWKPYLSNVSGNPASILVNLGLRKQVPIRKKPWLLWTRVFLQSPPPDGISDNNETPTLFRIEDALDLSISNACRAMLCGRISTDGRREFYFYGETTGGLRQTVEAAMTSFPAYRFDLGDRKDPHWDHYLKVLYPSPESLQRIANTDLLEALAKKGDVLTAPREVRHWAYFSSRASRISFRNAALAAGFKFGFDRKVEGRFPFGINLIRIQPIDQASIDDTALQLLALSRRYHGNYTGWEFPVVTP